MLCLLRRRTSQGPHYRQPSTEQWPCFVVHSRNWYQIRSTTSIGWMAVNTREIRVNAFNKSPKGRQATKSSNCATFCLTGCNQTYGRVCVSSTNLINFSYNCFPWNPFFICRSHRQFFSSIVLSCNFISQKNLAYFDTTHTLIGLTFPFELILSSWKEFLILLFFDGIESFYSTLEKLSCLSFVLWRRLSSYDWASRSSFIS